MNGLTIVWSMCSGICVALGLLYILWWSRNRSDIAYLLSGVMALGAAASGITELNLIHTYSTNTYQLLLKWEVLFVYVLLIPMVWLVHVRLDRSQRLLALIVTTMWTVALFLNFTSPGSLVYEKVTEIRQQITPWGEAYSVAIGPANPWNLLSNAAVALIVIYVIIASLRAWRSGKKRRAVNIGGSIVVFLLFGWIHSMLVDNGIIASPYMVSFAYLAIVLAMSYELVDEAIQVPLLTREVSAEQRRWRELLDNVQLAVIAIDRDGTFTYANPFFQKLTGYSADELAYKSAFDLAPDPEREESIERLNRSTDAAPPAHSVRSVICANGETRTLAWSMVHQFDNHGNAAGLISVGSDITEQRKAQNALHQTQHEMERMMRANLLGELASTLAHELNQPLAAILTNAQAARRMLKTNKLEPAELSNILDDIVSDDKRAGEVIRTLLALVRRGVVEKQDFSIDTCVEEVLGIVRGEIEAQGVRINLDIPPTLPKMRANRVEIQQVLMNLLVNAIRVQVTAPMDQRAIDIRVTVEDDMIKLLVHDHGPGVKEGELEKIFLPFFTTRDDGLGMGLTLSRRIVQAHGGEMRVDNHPQGGAVFQFTIPSMA